MKGNNKIKVISTLLFLALVFNGCSSSAKVEKSKESDSKAAISESLEEEVKKEGKKPSEKENIEEKPRAEIKAEEAGVLIGLSREAVGIEDNDTLYSKIPQDYRTLWITYDGKNVQYKERQGSIIAPNGNSFYEIYNDMIESKEESGIKDTDDIYTRFNYVYSYNFLVSSILGKDKKPLFTEEAFRKEYGLDGEDWLYQGYSEWPCFIGPKYAAILTSFYETGGGTYRSGKDEVFISDTASLGKVQDRKKTKKLYDLLDKKLQQQLNEFIQEKNAELAEKAVEGATQRADLENLTLTRKEGRWILQIPVYEDYYHEGNGSNFKSVVEYISYEGNLPKAITSHDTLSIPWQKIEEEIPGAIDAFSSPNKMLLVVMTENELLIFTDPEKDLVEPEYSIELNKGERVIMNQWAVDTFTAKWNEEIAKYFE